MSTMAIILAKKDTISLKRNPKRVSHSSKSACIPLIRNNPKIISVIPQFLAAKSFQIKYSPITFIIQ